MGKEGCLTHWNWVNIILPAWEQLRRNSSVRGVSLIQQKRHVQAPRIAVRSYAKQMQSISQSVHYMNSNK